MREEKKTVQDFYDRFGWELTRDGVYKDTATWVDLRPVMLAYYSRARKRARRFFGRQGAYFLDAGSGALPHPEYVDYSHGYDTHVCVDLSMKGLQEARKKLQERGAYVLADITRLPFPDEVFHAVSSSHAIYHIPGDEQGDAVLELCRVLKPDCTCLITYAWPACRFSDWISRDSGPRWLRGMKGVLFLSERLRQGVADDVPPLYFHAHDARWFHQLLGSTAMEYQIRCSQLIDGVFSRALVPDNVFGTLLLAFISLLEDWFPHGLATVGRYAFIRIRRVNLCGALGE